MKRAILPILFLMLTLVPIASYAASINVTISDGTTTLTPDTAGVLDRGFSLSGTATAGLTDTLNILALTASVGGNCIAPCTRHFPSGNAVAQTGDTFKIQDISSTNRARVIKTDASTDKIEIKGIKVTSTASGTGKTLKITFGTTVGAFNSVPFGTYAGGASLKGSYRQGTAIANACTFGVSTPCVKQTMQVQGVTLNGQGGITGLWTVSVPCSTTDSSTAPCGTGGSWNPQLTLGDQFFANDTSSLTITTNNCTPDSTGNCPVVHKGTLEVTATAGNQLFTSTNSATQYFAGVTVEDPSGLAGILAGIAGEAGAGVWAGYDSCVSAYRAVWRPPLTNETRNIQNNASLPVKAAVERAIFGPATGGLRVVSILDGDESLPSQDQRCNDSGYVVFVPGSSLKFSDVNTVILNYDVITGIASSGDTRLGDLSFEDCSNAAEIRLEITLEKDGVSAGKLLVYLGSDSPTNFKKNCDNPSLTGVNLVTQDTAARVDPSKLTIDAQPCCIPWSEAKKNSDYGKFLVKAITLVVDKGSPASSANHQVNFTSGNVNGVSSTGALLTATGNFQSTCEIPPDGRQIQFFKLVGNNPQLVFTASNTTVDSCEVRTTINVNELLPDVGGTHYDVYLQFFGGISLAGVGQLNLK